MHARVTIPMPVLFCGLLLIAGCGESSKMAEVSGTLTRNGNPVPYLTVHFVPFSGRSSWGLADEKGRFSLKQDNKIEGAVVGMHKVWVDWRPRSPQEEMEPKNAKKPAELDKIKEKYGSESVSPLKIEITKDVNNLEIKLD
jgi:hypothetical protein